MKNGDINFDKFRKERRHRRAQFGGVPATEARNNGLRDAEAYEERQVQETRLTRDVHEFLAQATKQAAQIVEKVTHAAEQESAQRLTREVQEFLQETVRRAASFLRLVQAGAFGTATQDVETHVSNLLGQALDGFRFEGTAQISDKHIGQNPFVEAAADDDADDAEGADDGDHADDSIDLTPSPVAVQPKPAAPAATAAPAAAAEAKPPAAKPTAGMPLLDKLLGGDLETLKKALKALVKAGVMTQDQAREIYRADLAARSQ